MFEDEINRKAGELAKEIISISEAMLLLNMRFLAKAVSRIPAYPSGESISCDGKRISYNPKYVLERYRQGERFAVHDLLHIIMHCIFRHWNTGGDVQEIRWDTACDIAAEAVIMDSGEFAGIERKAEKSEIISMLSGKIKPLTAEKIYNYFVKNDIPDEIVLNYGALFHTDDHSGWHKNREYEPEEGFSTIGIGAGQEDKSGDSSGNTDNQGNDSGNQDAQEEPAGNVSLEKWLENNRRQEMQMLESMWEEISKEIQSELENFDKKCGKNTGNLLQAIEYTNRDRCDYAAFLKKFAVSGEVLKSDEDNFDYNFYTYGLSVYGNVALVEPLEYKETKRVRDFVIAVDTSGSVQGDIVRNFIRKTYSILKSEESFFSRVNIYIIQCDSEIREAVKITCSAEFEEYIRNMEIKGLGGTDFRPVFGYVESLVQNHEFSALKGILYFTDGYGRFPEKRPPYDTAFAFIKNEGGQTDFPDVPPWAIRLILEEDDILWTADLKQKTES